MVEALILVYGEKLQDDLLMISLSNAKQLIIGSPLGFGVILHLTANTSEDLNKAIIDISEVAEVEEVSVLKIKKY